jgi:hypothetical protein
MLDARTLSEIPAHWPRYAQTWRGAAFVWTRYGPGDDAMDHDHCLLCEACICDARDRDPYDKPGPVENGHYRHAFRAEDAEGRHVWVCRSCFKRVQHEFGWSPSPQV